VVEYLVPGDLGLGLELVDVWDTVWHEVVPRHAIQVYRGASTDTEYLVVIGTPVAGGDAGEPVGVRGTTGEWIASSSPGGVLGWTEAGIPLSLTVQGTTRDDAVGFANALVARTADPHDGFDVDAGLARLTEEFPAATEPTALPNQVYWYVAPGSQQVTLSINVTALPIEMRNLDLFTLPGTVTEGIGTRTVSRHRQLQAIAVWWIEGSSLITMSGGFSDASIPRILDGFDTVDRPTFEALRQALSDEVAALNLLDTVRVDNDRTAISIESRGDDPTAPAGYCLVVDGSRACKRPLFPESFGEQ
jgi:hypothetical protein